MLREVGAVVCMAVGLLELEAVLGFLGCCLSVYFSVLALLLQSLHSFQTHSEKVNVQVLVHFKRLCELCAMTWMKYHS